MARLLVLALGAAILYYLIRNELRRRSATSSKDAQERPSATMIKDPMCGTFVSEDSISVKDGDTVHRFCSYECRDAFLDTLRDQGRAIPPKTGKQDESED